MAYIPAAITFIRYMLPDGNRLTEDFPVDHLHHRGVFLGLAPDFD